jgi:hypothetical protein
MGFTASLNMRLILVNGLAVNRSRGKNARWDGNKRWVAMIRKRTSQAGNAGR